MRTQIAFLLIAQQEIANSKKSGLPDEAMAEAVKAQECITKAIAICERA